MEHDHGAHLPPTRTDDLTATSTSSLPLSSESLENEIHMLEQELERKKLEGQIRQLEEQLKAAQITSFRKDAGCQYSHSFDSQ
jgi:23S rRNA maturation-related 3'-5' exoribonuclease YhaM